MGVECNGLSQMVDSFVGKTDVLSVLSDFKFHRSLFGSEPQSAARETEGFFVLSCPGEHFRRSAKSDSVVLRAQLAFDSLLDLSGRCFAPIIRDLYCASLRKLINDGEREPAISFDRRMHVVKKPIVARNSVFGDLVHHAGKID